MVFKEITCSFCQAKFQRKTSQINEAVKFGWNQYCSSKCQSKARLNGEYKICQTCDKNIWRTPKETKNSRTGRYFCNTSCAAIFNNHLRLRTKEPMKTCTAEKCNNLVKDEHRIYCSRKCGASARKRTLKSLKMEVLSKIRKFYNFNKRIPVKKEIYNAYRKARNAFGTWNKAIKAAGYEPNPVMFAKRYVARDGHQCDSLAEKIIDEWFYSKDISHERRVSYPEFKRMTCDFVVNNFFIEFFGLEGQHRKYTKLVHKKRRLSKKYGIKLIEIKPDHLFPKNRLDQVLNFLI